MSRYLELRRITKEYPGPGGPAVVVRGFDLDLEEGEFVSLIGHSGCGKSTVLAIAAGLVEATAGSVAVAGREIRGAGPDRGVVFQAACLLPWLTAEENVRLGVDQAFAGRSRAERQEIARHYLRLVGLDADRRKRPGELSAGMCQRVGVARAFALSPKVLLLDEPFGMLDPLTRYELQEILLDLWSQDRKTALMVTHDVDEALFLSDRVALMTSGPAARLAGVLEVPFPRPRDRRAVLEHRGYDALREQVVGFLEDQAAPAPPVERPPAPATQRRQFLGTSLTALAGALLPHGGTYASDAPEVGEMKFGIIALTDCSPIVIAHEKGFFKAHGVNAVVSKGANWAAIRDALSTGDNQATHMLLGMPLASTMGLLGSPRKPMVIPWMLNRNGQSITLKSALKGKVAADPKALRPLAMEAKGRGVPLTFAMTFPTGTHAMWMRYWLGAGGIHPDRDVSLITVPPPQMVANMKVGKMDGFCVGEPWNARAVADGIGYTALNTQDIWKDHPEKVCAFTAEFAERNPKAVKAVLKALHRASVWLDTIENRPEHAEIVSRPTYINCPKEVILGRLQGRYDFGDGRRTQDPNSMIFSARNCNYPQTKHAVWWLTQFRRWGMVEGAPDYAGVARQVMRADLYEEAMKELGYKHGGPDSRPETLFDGAVFDPARPEAYARSFAVHGLKG